MNLIAKYKNVIHSLIYDNKLKIFLINKLFIKFMTIVRQKIYRITA